MAVPAVRVVRCGLVAAVLAACPEDRAGSADFAAPHPDPGLVALLTATLGSVPAGPLGAATVPVVGCPADGQLGPMPPPKVPATVRVLVADGQQQRLAYYKAEPTQGVLAPKGWTCFGVYGSDGDALLVVPRDGNSRPLAFNNMKTSGPAVVASTASGGTSGRFEVASVGARVFPAIRKFVEGVRDEGLSDPKDYVFSPWPADKLARISDRVVAFTTPAHAAGLGNSQYLEPSNVPVRGVAFLAGAADEPDLGVLRARLAPSDADLYAAIAVNALPGSADAGDGASAPDASTGAPVTLARFGCSVSVPAVFSRRQEAPADNDGVTLLAPDGATLRLFGENNAASASIASFERTLEQEKDLGSVTYRAAGPAWLVLSGYRGRDIYYRRVMLSGDHATICTVDLQYPAARRASYDAMGADIAGSLSAP